VACVQNEYWEVQRHGHEADHSSPASVEVKNAWRYTTISTYPLIKHTDTSTCAVRLFSWLRYRGGGEKKKSNMMMTLLLNECVQTPQPHPAVFTPSLEFSRNVATLSWICGTGTPNVPRFLCCPSLPLVTC
jgi:hypothetical protein